ncbi:MAG: alkaline phosphatase PhoX [Gemmatimonadota bacterium]
MRPLPSRFIRHLALTGAIFAIACENQPTRPPEPHNPDRMGFESRAIQFSFSDPGFFTPLANSAVCSVGGGVSQFELPTGFVPVLVDKEPNFPDLGDMQTVNETGSEKGRFLYRSHELGSNGAVSVTDLKTGVSRILAQRADWERLDGIVWTPWGTILTAEETNPAAIQDPSQPNAVGGFVYEIDPLSGVATVRPDLGSKSHEGMRFDRQGNLYGISETSPGYIYKFIPATPGNLSSGQLYALKITQDLGDRTGPGQWVPLDMALVRLNADAAAAAVGATGYNRPEDVETSASTGDDLREGRMLFVAITGEDRVLGINLRSGNQLVVSDYVRDGVNAPADFDFPDNLALDQQGNLFITEDPGGSAPTKTLGDDVWLARFNPASASQSLPAERFLSITDCNAEPTGIYFSPSNLSLFVDVQHRGGDGADGSFAIQKIADIQFAPGKQGVASR